MTNNTKSSNLKLILGLGVFTLVGLIFLGVLSSSGSDATNRDVAIDNGNINVHNCTVQNSSLSCPSGYVSSPTLLDVFNSSNSSSTGYTISQFTYNNNGTEPYICINDGINVDGLNSTVNVSINCWGINPDISAASRSLLRLLPLLFLISMIILVTIILIKKAKGSRKN